MPRFSRKRALSILFACVVTSSIYFYASHTGRSKISIAVDDIAKRASALHSPRSRDVESLRSVSRRASPVASFDFEFAELKVQRVVAASAVGDGDSSGTVSGDDIDGAGRTPSLSLIGDPSPSDATDSTPSSEWPL